MDFSDKIKNIFFVFFRIWKYKFLSDCNNVSGKPNMFHPILLKGKGKISFDKNVQIGVVASPNFYSHYAYLEARNSDSEITIGNNVSIGHNALVHGCTIHDNVLIGMGSIVMDGCVVHSNSIIAAGAVVLEGTIVEEGSIYAGVPAKKVKMVSEAMITGEINRIADNYVKYSSWFEVYNDAKK